MLRFLAFFISFGSQYSWGSYDKSMLETGDILLQPLSCWSCELIEKQESSKYSHIGIVIKKNHEIFVAEAIGRVSLIPLSRFLMRTQKDSKVKVRRLKNLLELDKLEVQNVVESLLGSPYDKNFRWDNFDGELESFYCSEFVYKSLDRTVGFISLTPKEMLYDINPKAWDTYFQKKTPRGELGISPEDFNKSFEFEDMGYI